MDNDSLNDKEISKVFEDCFRQFFKPLCYYAMGFVKDGEAAKDLVHDAFLSAWTHRHEIDFSLPMYPYFLNLTRNNAINYLEHCEVRARHAASEMPGRKTLQRNCRPVGYFRQHGQDPHLCRLENPAR